MIKTRLLGKTGWKVSELGFGAWAIAGDAWGKQADDESLQALAKALDLGVTFIDTAAGYGAGHSEKVIGRMMEERNLKRGGGEVKIATKVHPVMDAGMIWPPLPEDNAAERYPANYIRKTVETSLKNLKAEALDVIQLHTWTRAWNKDPQPLLELRKLQAEGKVLAVGMSTPEHDQNAYNSLMVDGLLDTIQVIYNIFEREPEAELLPIAKEQGVGVIVRCVFDESALTGKLTNDTKFGEGDFRNNYFRGDRLTETVKRVEAIKADLAGKDLAAMAIRFALAHDAVSTVIPGMRSVSQVEKNLAVSGADDLSAQETALLRKHIWRKPFWYD